MEHIYRIHKNRSVENAGEKGRTARPSAAAPDCMRFSLLVKPVGPLCNLRCAYCFYLKKAQLFPAAARMGDATLGRLINSYTALPLPSHDIAFQGGEPTLAGLDFYERAAALGRASGKRVNFSLQTNGVLLDDAWAAFLKENHCLTGVSLDGPAAVHDARRRDAHDGPTHTRVMEGIAAMRRHGAPFNILTLVSSANVEKGSEVYRWFTGEGFHYQQYIPCVSEAAHAVTGEEYGRFLLDVFGEWLKRDTRAVSVRNFDAVISILVGGLSTVCQTGGACDRYLVVEHDGGVYPCDFFVEQALRLGGVMDEDFAWESVINGERYAAFARQKHMWPAQCNDCPYLAYCSGDCMMHRAAGREGVSVLCEGYKLFYGHALSELKRLAGDVRARMALPGGRTPFPEQPYERNAPCFCGSGRKRKHCHG